MTPATKSKATKATKKKSPSKSAVKPTDPAPPVDVGDPREAQATQTAERDRLTARITELRRQIAAGERSRSSAAAALRRAESALADVNRRLEEIVRRQREGQERLAGLDRQRTGTEEQIARRREAFAKTANLMDANLGGRDVVAWRDDAHVDDASFIAQIDLTAVARDQSGQLDALKGRARDLAAARQRADDDNRTLLAQADAQRNARDSLAANQAAQQKALEQLALQLADQRKTADALAADEKRLSRVVEQLQRVIERQAAEERAKREAAAAAAARKQADARRGKAPPPKTREPEPQSVDAVPDAASVHGAFAQLRGALRLPARGTIVGRFGAPRGTSGATWKGVFVRTEASAEVRAVAAGRIVFADDLRGFGNLLIVDHGDQYLSIYGNNAQLLKHTGDAVKPGDVIARAGDSSGDGETGLYFELRFQGRPFDPLGWTGGR